jgi:ribosomal protein S18 acetylase RimI-like enzyme
MAPDLFILAMDHRDSLAKKVYGIEAEPTAVDAERIADGKRVVFRGLLAALDRGADPSVTGVLVDERYGTAVANEARAAGLALAMPIERSGQEWFTLEYGNVGDDSWVEHIQRFAPDYVKVLVRDNPDFDSGCRAKQQEDLAVVSRRLHEMRWPFLFELLVPPTDAQRDTAGSHYDADLRPGLTQTVIHDFQRAGVEPDVWKIEGLEDAEAACGGGCGPVRRPTERTVHCARPGRADGSPRSLVVRGGRRDRIHGLRHRPEHLGAAAGRSHGRPDRRVGRRRAGSRPVPAFRFRVPEGGRDGRLNSGAAARDRGSESRRAVASGVPNAEVRMIERREIASTDADLRAMQSLCERTWFDGASWHIGDIPSGRRQHIGRDPEWPTALWVRGGEVLAWAWARLPDHLDLAVHPEHPELGSDVMAWFRSVATADELAAHALETEPHLVAAFAAAGFHPADDRHFMYRYTHDLGQLDEPAAPAGFIVRPVHGDGDRERRVEVHRSAFHPSRVTTESYANVQASWPYRSDLDWIVEAPDGRFAAFCLIWWDEVNRVGELEPVGTHADFRRLGVGRAACLGALRAVRDIGASYAIVNSYGAPENPGPRALYHSLGFVDRTRTVKYAGSRIAATTR